MLHYSATSLALTVSPYISTKTIYHIKNECKKARHQWLTPVILTIKEEAIRRIVV
jgi:hypothetical protein